MKTNVIMKSEKSRDLFGVIIKQETKTEMLSLTDLQEAYTHARVLHGWSEKTVDDVLRNERTVERIYYLLLKQNIFDNSAKKQKYQNVTLQQFKGMVSDIGIIKTLKEIDVYKVTGRGSNRDTKCNPYIWVLIAMELNPMLYAEVVMWLTDKLICNRIDACDLNIDLMKAVSENIPNPNYSEINRALNIKIFGRHETGMRNLASEEELKKLNELENEMRYCLKYGIAKTTEELCKAIEKA